MYSFKMKILIVEDDAFVAEDIRDKVEALGYEATGVAESYEEALEAIAKKRPDMVLLDIELKGTRSGIDLAAALAEMDISFIYLSNKQDLSTYQLAKSTNPVRNLPKPVSLLILRNVLDEAFSSRNTAGQATAPEAASLFFVTEKSKKVRIQPEDIVYIEAAGNYCDIYFTDGRRITPTSTMGEVIEKISQKNMVRIHRSYYINLHYVRSRDGNQIYMTVGKEPLPISDTYKDDLQRYFISL